MPVEIIDQMHKILRRTVSACRSKIYGRLISPRTVKEMLRQRQEFNVGEAHFLNIFRKPWSDFPIAEPPVAVFRNTAPRAEMNFIDRNRRTERVASGT